MTAEEQAWIVERVRQRMAAVGSTHPGCRISDPRVAAFPLGTRVRLSAKGRQWFGRAFAKRAYGIVIGYCRSSDGIIVQRFGLKQPNSFRASFLERI